MIMRRELYRLDWRKSLYDTMHTVAGVELDDDDALWLPRRVAEDDSSESAPADLSAA
jgi:hypothetical protein